jgi:hypothetical protein
MAGGLLALIGFFQDWIVVQAFDQTLRYSGWTAMQNGAITPYLGIVGSLLGLAVSFLLVVKAKPYFKFLLASSGALVLVGSGLGVAALELESAFGLGVLGIFVYWEWGSVLTLIGGAMLLLSALGIEQMVAAYY